MKYSISCLLLLCITVNADQTVWSYDLTYLPDGWWNTGYWEFQSTGAHVSMSAGSGQTIISSIYTETLLVPEGTDSLTINVQQHSSGGGNDGYGKVVLELYLNDEGMTELWKNRWYNYYGSDTLPINETVSVVPGDTLHFRFGAKVLGGGGSSGYGSVNWHLWDLELVLHGDIQALNPVSWSVLKSLF